MRGSYQRHRHNLFNKNTKNRFFPSNDDAEEEEERRREFIKITEKELNKHPGHETVTNPVRQQSPRNKANHYRTIYHSKATIAVLYRGDCLNPLEVCLNGRNSSKKHWKFHFHHQMNRNLLNLLNYHLIIVIVDRLVDLIYPKNVYLSCNRNLPCAWS